ncbi:MAG: histidinol-phosphate transaminase [Neisseriaceae bacterium]|nr:histidinol-phosphate transaminase [Neisseriaceae bacterium]MBP6863459.1 histidinol-phosphate transaminase [Neisseriaceae bacterium]
MSILEYVRPEIRSMQAYQVAAVEEGFIKLDAMESPYAYVDEMQEELGKQLSQAPINLYPVPNGDGLAEDLRAAFDIPPNAGMILGNGSDELIDIVTKALSKEGATLMALEPSFVMYALSAKLHRMRYVGVSLNEDFTLDLAATLAAIEAEQPALIFIAYPNNPTGGRFERADVETIIKTAKGVVVVDEAYSAFSSDTFMDLAGQYDNLIVMRTLSKIGFAGLRVGYAAGAPILMDEMAKVVPPYNMNQLSIVAAKFALQYQPFIIENTERLKAERERVRTALKAYEQIEDFPSEANFITIRVPDSNLLFDTLKQNKILVKHLHNAHPLLANCVRLTIGRPEDNQAVLAVIEQLYGRT